MKDGWRSWGTSVEFWSGYSSMWTEGSKVKGEGEAIQQSERLSRTHQEGEEQGSCREEVPDIVVIKESQQDAWPVLFPGLCWSLLGRQAEGQDLRSTPAGPLLHPIGITLS